MADLMGRSDEASKGAWQGILKVQGVLAPLERIPSGFETSSFGKGPPKDQAVITLEDAIILEMEEGEETPELKDDKFTFYLPYAAPGKEKAGESTFFTKGFCKSAELLCLVLGIAGGGYKDLIGTVVTMESQAVLLFKQRSRETGEVEEVTGNPHFLFVGAGDESPEDTDDHLRGLMVGKNQAAALRAVMMDIKGKRLGTAAEIRAMFEDGSLAERLGLVQDKAGKYSLAE